MRAVALADRAGKNSGRNKKKAPKPPRKEEKVFEAVRFEIGPFLTRYIQE
jgi:hypothetical protein